MEKKKNVKDLLLRLKHPQTILALIAGIGLLVQQIGGVIDSTWLSDTANIVYYILIVLGVLNNPKKSGSYIPFVTSGNLPDLDNIAEVDNEIAAQEATEEVKEDTPEVVTPEPTAEIPLESGVQPEVDVPLQSETPIEMDSAKLEDESQNFRKV